VKELSKMIEKIKEFEKNQENYTIADIQNKTQEFKKLFE
jgi:preprotein translocase subunit SecA